MIEPQLGIMCGLKLVDWDPVLGIAVGCMVVVALAFWWGR